MPLLRLIRKLATVMHQYQTEQAVVIAIGGFVLLVKGLANFNIHTRGADSIAGAILLGTGVLAMKRKQE